MEEKGLRGSKKVGLSIVIFIAIMLDNASVFAGVITFVTMIMIFIMIESLLKNFKKISPVK